MIGFKNALTLKDLFGPLYYAKLAKLLGACCEPAGGINLPCCPTEIYTVQIDRVDCTSSPGSAQLHTSVKVLIDPGIPTLLTVFLYNDVTLVDSNTGVAINGSGVLSVVIASVNTGITKLVVVDSFGNYSNILTIDTSTICS